MSAKGLIHQDIPKLRRLISAGHSADAIAAGMLGYRCPAHIVQQFLDPGPVTEVETRPEHPQDKAARIRREIDEAETASRLPPAPGPTVKAKAKK